MPLPSDYQVLGLTSSATLKEVKAAYRKLALQYHSDKQKEVNDTKFIEITNAYKAITLEESASSISTIQNCLRRVKTC